MVTHEEMSPCDVKFNICPFNVNLTVKLNVKRFQGLTVKSPTLGRSQGIVGLVRPPAVPLMPSSIRPHACPPWRNRLMFGSLGAGAAPPRRARPLNRRAGPRVWRERPYRARIRRSGVLPRSRAWRAALGIAPALAAGTSISRRFGHLPMPYGGSGENPRSIRARGGE